MSDNLTKRNELIKLLKDLRDNIDPSREEDKENFKALLTMFEENGETDLEIIGLCEEIYYLFKEDNEKNLVNVPYNTNINEVEHVRERENGIKSEKQMKLLEEKKENGPPEHFLNGNNSYYIFGCDDYRPYQIFESENSYFDLPDPLRVAISYRILCPQSLEGNFIYYEN